MYEKDFKDAIRGGHMVVGTPKVKDFTINLLVECPCERPAPVMLFSGCVGAAVMCAKCRRFHVLRGFQYFPEQNAIGWQLETVVALTNEPRTVRAPVGDPPPQV